MNVELARTFLEVIANGSLAGAADRLNVTHSTVTMRVKALEDILRCRLLIRNRSGVTMTAAGRRFYPLAESLTRTWQLTQRQMSLASGFEALLSVGAPSALWADAMFTWAAKSRRELPELALRCEVGRSEQLLERLFQGWLDFCLVFEARSRSGFIVERLIEDPLVTVSTENRQAMEKWDPDYIEIEWDEGVRRQEHQHYPDLIETPHLSSNDPDLALRFLMDFGGSVLLPERLLKTREFSRPLHRVPEIPVFEQSIYLVYSEAALQERLPRGSVAQLRTSILRQFAGEANLWEGANPIRRRRSRATAT